MESILNWGKGIIGFLLFMSLVLQCAPGKGYRPYLRLFMGIVFLLTVLSPLTGMTGLSEAIERLTGELAYREEVPGWEEKLLKGEEWVSEQIRGKAEEIAAELESTDNGQTGEERSEEKNTQLQTEQTADDREIEVVLEDGEIQEVEPVVIAGGER